MTCIIYSYYNVNIDIIIAFVTNVVVQKLIALLDKIVANATTQYSWTQKIMFTPLDCTILTCNMLILFIVPRWCGSRRQRCVLPPVDREEKLSSRSSVFPREGWAPPN